MFSVRTTLGSITIILADMAICLLVHIFFLTDVGFSFLGLAYSGNVLYWEITTITCMIVISLALIHLYSFMEYIYPIDLVKRFIPALLASFVLVTSLSFFLPSIVIIKWRLIPDLMVIFFPFVFVPVLSLLYFSKESPEYYDCRNQRSNS